MKGTTRLNFALIAEKVCLILELLETIENNLVYDIKLDKYRLKDDFFLELDTEEVDLLIFTISTLQEAFNKKTEKNISKQKNQ